MIVCMIINETDNYWVLWLSFPNVIEQYHVHDYVGIHTSNYENNNVCNNIANYS